MHAKSSLFVSTFSVPRGSGVLSQESVFGRNVNRVVEVQFDVVRNVVEECDVFVVLAYEIEIRFAFLCAVF